MNAPVNVGPTDDAWSMPLERIDVSNPHLYQDDTWHPYFERLRRDDPVHYSKDGIYGSFWSVTRYHDIMAVDTNHKAFSSDAMMGGIVIRDLPMDFRRPSFISMDPPKHDEQRKVVVADRRAGQSGTSCRAPSASAPAASWTICRAARRSTGSSASRSN